VTGIAGVAVLVLAEAVAGAAAILFSTPLWDEVKRGFFKLAGSITFVVAACAWLASRGATTPGDDAGRLAGALAAAFAALTGAWVLALFARRDALARGLAVVSVACGAVMLVALARLGRQPWALAALQLLAGAAFLGAVVDGLLLGHWYLTDRGLTRTPINRFTTVLIVAVLLEAIAVASAGFEAVGASSQFNPLLTAGALAPWIALGMIAATALIAVLIRLTLRGPRASAVQAATGFFYLAVVTAFTAEVAVKVRFLPR
jgi:hypothetical protein